MNSPSSTGDRSSGSAIEAAVNKTYPGLQLFARDVNLAPGLAEKYDAGLVICERGFTDATPRLGGMVTTHRFVIMSSHMADFAQLGLETVWQLHVAARNAHFKVLGTHRLAGKVLIFLLHLPDDDSWRLLASTSIRTEDGDLDAMLLADSIQRMERRLNEAPIPDVTSPEWLERCSFPLGMSDDGELFPVE